MPPPLPWELNVSILEWVYRFSQSRVVDYKTLASCTLVCKAWTPAAQWLLYRRIPLLPSFRRRARLLDAVKTHPVVGSYVRALAVASFPISDLLTLLSHCPNIRKLSFGPMEMLTATEFSQLRALNLSLSALHCAGGRIPIYQLLDLWPSVCYLTLDFMYCDDDPPKDRAPPPLEVICILQPLEYDLVFWLLPPDAAILHCGVREVEYRPQLPQWLGHEAAKLPASPTSTMASITAPDPRPGLLTAFQGLRECILTSLPLAPLELPPRVRHVGYHWQHYEYAPDNEETAQLEHLVRAFSMLPELCVVSATLRSTPETLEYLREACARIGVDYVVYSEPNEFPRFEQRPQYVDWLGPSYSH